MHLWRVLAGILLLISFQQAAGCGRSSTQFSLHGAGYVCRYSYPAVVVSPAVRFQAFAWGGTGWVAVSYDQMIPGQFYLREDPQRAKWVWITKDDWRPVAPGSKVQWRRIQPTGDAKELDWYRLGDKGIQWAQTTDRERPAVYRLEANNGKVLAEQYPADWASLGGTLDPETPPEPKCTITPTPRSVAVKTPILLRIDLQGTVDDVIVDDKHLPIHLEKKTAFAETTIVPEAPGFYTASATVRGPGGQSKCEAPYDVKPPELACQLTPDRREARTGDTVLVTLTSEGGTVEEASIDGVPVFGMQPDAEGKIRISRRVSLRESSAGLVVSAYVAGGGKRADCKISFDKPVAR